MSHGLYLAWSEPTALTLMIQRTSRLFSAQMFARWFSSEGRIRWPRACRGRNATSRSAKVPVRISSDGEPNGVFTRTHFCPVSPSIWYRPLPPIMPILLIGIAARSEAELGQFVLQLRLERRQIFLAWLVTLFPWRETETAHLVKIPIGGFAVAEFHVSAHQGTRPRHLVHIHRNTGDG